MNAETNAAPSVCPRRKGLAAMWTARTRLVPFFVAEKPDPELLELVRGIDGDLVEIARALEELAPRQGVR